MTIKSTAIARKWSLCGTQERCFLRCQNDATTRKNGLYWVRFEPLSRGPTGQASQGPCGGGLEYLHRSPASRKRRQEGNLVPGAITGPPYSWGYKYGNLAFQVGGLSDETVKYGREFCGTLAQE
jgi:hypothetical protein